MAEQLDYCTTISKWFRIFSKIRLCVAYKDGGGKGGRSWGGDQKIFVAILETISGKKNYNTEFGFLYHSSQVVASQSSNEKLVCVVSCGQGQIPSDFLAPCSFIVYAHTPIKVIKVRCCSSFRANFWVFQHLKQVARVKPAQYSFSLVPYYLQSYD